LWRAWEKNLQQVFRFFSFRASNHVAIQVNVWKVFFKGQQIQVEQRHILKNTGMYTSIRIKNGRGNRTLDFLRAKLLAAAFSQHLITLFYNNNFVGDFSPVNWPIFYNNGCSEVYFYIKTIPASAKEQSQQVPHN